MKVCALFVMTSLLGAETSGDWPTYGRDPGGQRFSPLALIHRGNVKSLRIAWIYRTGDAYQPKNSRPTAFESTLLHIGNTLYLSTPLGRIIALDPVTGTPRWSYDPKIDRDKGYGDFANRGMMTSMIASISASGSQTISARLPAPTPSGRRLPIWR